MYRRSFCISRCWNSYSIDPSVVRFGDIFPFPVRPVVMLSLMTFATWICPLLPYSTGLLIHDNCVLPKVVIVSWNYDFPQQQQTSWNWPPTAKFLYFFQYRKKIIIIRHTRKCVCEYRLSTLLRIAFYIRINKILFWLWKLAAAGAHSVHVTINRKNGSYSH